MEEINEMQNLDVFIKWIHQGNLVVYPTETLYALGADIWNKEAVDTVYIVKQRPRNQPLSIAVSSLSEVEDIADVTSSAMVLAQRFLPGPLTVVLQKRTENLAYLTGGGTAIAIRVPNHPLALSLLSMCGPLTCTSANLHQTLPPSSIIEIAKDFSSHASQLKYIDAGLLKGTPSTIVDCTTSSPKVLREGAISTQAIRDALTYE